MAGRVQVFTEAEIRASVVFQLSKLVTLLLKAARLATGGGAWDALVAGTLFLPLAWSCNSSKRSSLGTHT